MTCGHVEPVELHDDEDDYQDMGPTERAAAHKVAIREALLIYTAKVRRETEMAWRLDLIYVGTGFDPEE